MGVQRSRFEKIHHDKKNAIRNYEKYVLKGIGIESELDFKTGCANGMLGDQVFIDDVLTMVQIRENRKIELPELIAKVCDLHNVSR